MHGHQVIQKKTATFIFHIIQNKVFTYFSTHNIITYNYDIQYFMTYN